jgi:hypothetical protein
MTTYRISTVGIVAALLMLLVLGSTGAALAITNGQPDGNDHPYVGLVVFDYNGVPAWRTTGILISPTIVVTAGHGTDDADGARVWFDSDLTGNAEYPFGGSTSTEGTPHTHPDFCTGCGKGLPRWDTNDVGVVVLDEPVILSEYAELALPGMVETLAMKTDLDLIGYGYQSMTKGAGRPRLAGVPDAPFRPGPADCKQACAR